MIACPNNIYPLIPHFYINIVKLGYTGVNMFFLFLIQNIDCGYSLEPPLFFFSKTIKNIKIFFFTENFQFLQLRKSLYITWACFHIGTLLKTKSRDVMLLLLDERHHVKTLHQTNVQQLELKSVNRQQR